MYIHMYVCTMICKIIFGSLHFVNIAEAQDFKGFYATSQVRLLKMFIIICTHVKSSGDLNFPLYSTGGLLLLIIMVINGRLLVLLSFME